jgi:UDP-N-acetylmuramoyl-tripeptide--D-alanyl-D-alanine ligase
MKLGRIAQILSSGSVKQGLAASLAETEPGGYSIDSRTVKAGDLFFAIRGEKNDGHRFLVDAFNKGAVAAVVEKGATAPLPGEADQEEVEPRLIRVGDTLEALQSLASKVIESWQGREVAITGSAGKTTTKDLTAAILSQQGPTLKSYGNLNNAYGLPLSVLAMESDGHNAGDFEFAVLEMGMNHMGEIQKLVGIAPPSIGVVTNVSAVHLEFFSSEDQIAEAKSELIQGILPGGWAVLNADDKRVIRMRDLRDDLQIRTFSIDGIADVTSRDGQSSGVDGEAFTLVTPSGEAQVKLPLIGIHNVYNALAAAAVSDLCGVPVATIAATLGHATTSRMRGEVIRFREGFTLIDDSYNSNPSALLGQFFALSECERRIVVAGEMLELGPKAPWFHRNAGQAMGDDDVELLIGVRGLAREMVEGARDAGIPEERAIFVEEPEEAAEILADKLRAGDVILVKGSRGVRMEKFVERIKQRFDVMGGEN